MAKLYKFYKSNCAPCYSMQRLLDRVGIPEGVELVSLNVDEPKNMIFGKSLVLTGVPTLMFEGGNSLVGLKKEEELKQFLGF